MDKLFSHTENFENLINKEIFINLNQKAEHRLWTQIHDIEDLPILHSLDKKFDKRLSKNIKDKLGLDLDTKEKEACFSSLDAPKELRHQVGPSKLRIYKLKYLQERRALLQKAHQEFNNIFPPDKFTFAFFGSFLLFANDARENSYMSLPGDIDADGDIKQF
ncbi:MAG: hypothetical protein GXP45_02975 [bacterium]|nr:hypothetical protein [bacterium]